MAHFEPFAVVVDVVTVDVAVAEVPPVAVPTCLTSSSLCSSLSCSVALFDAKTNKATRSVTRFKDVARSGRYRGDGRLLVAGCDDAVVKVFDLASKSILRAFVGHKGYGVELCIRDDVTWCILISSRLISSHLTAWMICGLSTL